MSKNDHAFKSTSSIRKVKIKLKIEACFTHIYHIFFHGLKVVVSLIMMIIKLIYKIYQKNKIK